MKRLTLALVAIAAVGILGSIFDDYFAGVYAFFGLLLLMGVQLSAMARGNRGWLFWGGNLRQVLTATEVTYASFGLAMMCSALAGYLLHMWLQSP
jgi:hypothetical protein